MLDKKEKRKMNIREKAAALVKIREHSSDELRRKLKLKGYPLEEIESLLTKYIKEGIVDDTRFAEVYLLSLMRNKTYGYYGLLAKLLSRGIAKDVAQDCLKENLSVQDEIKIARRFASRPGVGEGLKLMSKLSRRGFRREAIQALASDDFTD